jgi:hypothetical protein
MNRLKTGFFFYLAMFLFAGLTAAQVNLPPPNLGDVQPAPSAPVQPSPGSMPEVTISARVESSEVPLNEIVTFVVELRWDKKLGETAELDFEFPDPPSAEGLTPVGNSFRTTTQLEGSLQHVLRHYTYEYQPKQEGKTRIDKAVVAYRRRGQEDETTLETHPLEVTIIPPVRGIKDLAQSNIAKIIIALILLSAASVLAIAVLRERKKRIPPEPLVTETLEETYTKRLKENETLRIAGRWTDYFLGLSSLLRGYLEENYNIRTQGQTTDRLVHAVRERLGDEQAEEILGFLLLCDRVKFAGHQPGSAEMDQAYETVRRIIQLGESEEKISEQGG